MSLLKTLKNSFYFGVIPKISTLINVILLPVITPYLTPYDYGVWGIISSYLGFIAAIVPLGLNMHLSNSFFEYKQWRLVWGRILLLFFISGLIGAIVFVVILLMELDEFSYGKRLLIGICSFFPILLFGNGVLASHLYPLLENPKPLVFRNLAGSLCAVAVTFITIYVFHLGFWGFILGVSTSSVVTFILFIPPLYFKEKIRPTIDKNVHRVKEWIKVASPVIPHTLGFILLTSSSRMIMSWYNVPLQEIGIYSNGYMMGDYITIVAGSLATALSPHLQMAYREQRWNDYRKMYYLCQVIVLGAIFSVSIWMSDIYCLLIRNPAFEESVSVASYICYANALMPLYVFISNICFIDKKTAQLLWLIFLPGLLNAIICLLFIPQFGYRIAVYSTLIAFWSQLLVPFLSRYHRYKLHLWLGSRWKLLLLFLLLIVSVSISNVLINLPVYIKFGCTIGIVFIVLLIIRQKRLDLAVVYKK